VAGEFQFQKSIFLAEIRGEDVRATTWLLTYFDKQAARP
jgi:hypothetical protein